MELSPEVAVVSGVAGSPRPGPAAAIERNTTMMCELVLEVFPE
jgi:hypothetical protein